jgi:hypothetical protein
VALVTLSEPQEARIGDVHPRDISAFFSPSREARAPYDFRRRPDFL